MANATATVPQYIVAWGDDLIERGNETLGTAATYYPGSMMAIDSNGLAVKCTDAAGIKFDGILADGVSQYVAVGDASYTTKFHVERPFRFAMSIAAAAPGDEGKPVYATFDNAVGYSSVNSVLVGWVDKVMSTTQVLIRPAYGGNSTAGNLSSAGNAAIANASSISPGGSGTVGLTISSSSTNLGIYVGSGRADHLGWPGFALPAVGRLVLYHAHVFGYERQRWLDAG